MNPEELESCFKESQTVKLDEQAKESIRQNLVAYMKKNPAQEKRAWFGSYIPANVFRLKTANAMLAGMLILLLGGGVASVQAAAALPGDLLYPVKINFNEKLQESLAFSQIAKLELHMKLAEKRLQEIEKLTVDGKINITAQSQSQSNFNDHANRASGYLAKLHKQDKYQQTQAAASKFEGSLKAHALIINVLQAQASSTASAPLLRDIEGVTRSFIDANASINSNNKIPADSLKKEKSVLDKITAAENSLAKAQRLLQKNKNRIGSQAAAQSQENLDFVQQRIDQVKEKVKNKTHDY